MGDGLQSFRVAPGAPGIILGTKNLGLASGKPENFNFGGGG